MLPALWVLLSQPVRDSTTQNRGIVASVRVNYGAATKVLS